MAVSKAAPAQHAAQCIGADANGCAPHQELRRARSSGDESASVSKHRTFGHNAAAPRTAALMTEFCGEGLIMIMGKSVAPGRAQGLRQIKAGPDVSLLVAPQVVSNRAQARR